MPNRSSMMERLRAELLRRARLERQPDLEANVDSDTSTPPQVSSTPPALQTVINPPARGFQFRLPQLFGRSQQERVQDEPEVQSPKSPAFVSRRPPTLPPMHLDYQSLSDSVANPGRGQPTPPMRYPDPSSIYSRSEPSSPVQAHIARPEAAARAPSRSNTINILGFSSPDPEEQALAQLGIDGRRHRDERERRRQRRREREGRTEESRPERQRRRERRARRERKKKPPTTFLFCFPWVKSARMRTLILRCFVSGVFLAAILGIYLGLSLSNSIRSGEFTIVLVLTVLVATGVFCHALLRVFLLLYRGEKPRDISRTQHYLSPNGYAVPEEPIPVVLAQDEEARIGDEGGNTGQSGDAGKPIPPAYGLWRGSVRVDPDRLFWQRNETAASGTRPESRTGPRPPSYASDDGVSYVVDAAPRSTAPPMSEVDMPMPLHPSEVGRVARPVS